jgi:hypothetical protein
MRKSICGKLFLLAVIGLLWVSLAGTVAAGDDWCPFSTPQTCVQTKECADQTGGHSKCMWSYAIDNCNCELLGQGK